MRPTQRFSSRVDNYVKYRPGYPEVVVELLVTHCGLSPSHTVADVGSGTGLSAELFLRRGCHVFGVEPNREMREAGERLLSGYPRFTSIEGTAERTTLPDSSIDLIVAAQAFHWFQRPDARAEFERILRPGGWVALLWNARRASSTPFLAAYEQLLREYATDYAQVNHVDLQKDEIRAFFSGGCQAFHTFDNEQRFDFEGLSGRLLSSSYAPEPGQACHEAMLRELRRIFEAFKDSRGQVTFEYDTEVHLGRVGAAPSPS